MYKKGIIGEGLAVETHGRASLSALGKKTHGRASLRRMYGGASLAGIWRKTHGRASLLVGLIFLFGACERDIEGEFGEGKKVEIFFSTNITNYHTGADVTRNAGLQEPESRTIYINDSIYLQTTLVPDEEEETTFDGSQLRAPVDFEDGQKVCFEAYNVASSATPVDSKIYTYSNGKFIPDTDPLGVVPDDGTVFRFVAYSYFGETGVAPAASSIDPAHDLIWGKTATDQTITDTETSRTVSISMTHKFARVKVNVNSGGITGADIEALSGVSIDGGQLAGLTPFSGSVNWSGTATQGIADPFTVISSKERESGYRTVKPVAAGALKVKVGSVKISTTATTFTNQTVSFTPALNVATSYTLMVAVKKCNWARSNIYWDGSKLTFVADPNDLSKQGYQGVYFKFGSLVGISPAPTSGSDAFSGSTPVYIPTYDRYTYANSSWEKKDSHSYTSAGWPQTSNTEEDAAANIPYLDGRSAYNASLNTGRGSTFVIDSDRNTDEMYESLRGDICQYLCKTEAVTGDYRLPTSNELGPASGWTYGGRNTPDNTLGNDEGTVPLLDNATNNVAWAKNDAMGNVIFPASGSRSSSGGGLGGGAYNGYYWSGSAYNNLRGHYLFFTYNSVSLDYYTSRSIALPIRCVKN